MLHPELPQNIEAERAVLGSVLMNRDALIPIAPWLKPSHFYSEVLGWIYAAMLACLSVRKTPDLVNLITELRKSDRLEQVGGIPALAELTDTVPSSYEVENYAREVERCAVLRQLITAGGKIAGLGYDQRADASAAIAEAQQMINGVQTGAADETLMPLSATIDAYYDKLDRVNRGEASALGVQTGFRDLDEITAGLHDDEFTIIGARPMVGKTSFLLSLAYNIATRADNPRDVLIYSLEMNREQLLIRLLSMETRIDTHRLRTLRLNEEESGLVMEAMGRLAELRVFLADIPAMTPDQVRLAAHRHIAQHSRPVLPMIDYLQLMNAGRKTENRVQDVSDISRALKTLGRSLHSPVIALSQLSRAVEGRTDNHIPRLSDLRESGSLEQDADNVWFLYREELYDKNTDKKGLAELHIAKQRQGPIGVIPMHFDASTTRFETLTYRTPEGY